MIRTPWCSAPLTLITLAVARIRDHRKKGARPEAEITTLKAAPPDSNAELSSRLVGRLGSRNGYAVHATSAIYPHDWVREMGLGEASSREVRLATPLLDARLLWVPLEDWVFGCASCIFPDLAVGQIKPIARHFLAL